MLVIRMAILLFHRLPCPLPIIITSIPYKYHQNTSHPSTYYYWPHTPFPLLSFASFCLFRFLCLRFGTTFSWLNVFVRVCWIKRHKISPVCSRLSSWVVTGQRSHQRNTARHPRGPRLICWYVTVFQVR